MGEIRFDYELQAELKSIISRILVPGKGIMACDESEEIMGNLFEAIGLVNTEETRRQYRQMLFTTDAKFAQYISSVIVFHQSLYHIADDKELFINHLKKRDLVVGIKMEKGAVQLFNTDDYITQGMDDLQYHCVAFKKDGCEFAKWKALFKIGANSPSRHSITNNVNLMSCFAGVCQTNRIVPLLHVEVLRDGDADIHLVQEVLQNVYSALFKSLTEHGLYMEGLLLVTNMVRNGHQIPKNTPTEVANATIEALRRTVPPAVPGILMSSGGQSEENSTINLNAICQSPLVKPWTISFCFSRSMQASALHMWKGDPEAVKEAQNELLKRAEANSLALRGQYTPGLITTVVATESFFMQNTY